LEVRAIALDAEALQEAFIVHERTFWDTARSDRRQAEETRRLFSRWVFPGAINVSVSREFRVSGACVFSATKASASNELLSPVGPNSRGLAFCGYLVEA
jgi:hypothetical protein